MKMNKMEESGIQTTKRRQRTRARALLRELETLGPAELAEWNIRMQTFLVFEAARRHCMGGGER